MLDYAERVLPKKHCVLFNRSLIFESKERDTVMCSTEVGSDLIKISFLVVPSRLGSWPYTQTLDQERIGGGTNALTYLASSSMTKKGEVS